MAEALVKALTGGDTISARFLRGEFFTLRATFKLWLATNHKPVIRGTDPAIWDRIKLVNDGLGEGFRFRHAVIVRLAALARSPSHGFSRSRALRRPHAASAASKRGRLLS